MKRLTAKLKDVVHPRRGRSPSLREPSREPSPGVATSEGGQSSRQTAPGCDVHPSAPPTSAEIDEIGPSNSSVAIGKSRASEHTDPISADEVQWTQINSTSTLTETMNCLWQQRKGTAKKVLTTVANISRLFLRLVKEGSDACPPLKGAAGVMMFAVDAYDVRFPDTSTTSDFEIISYSFRRRQMKIAWAYKSLQKKHFTLLTFLTPIGVTPLRKS
jgi:hypothetical protein